MMFDTPPSAEINNFMFDWIGRYESSDPSEKVYSYCFTIYDSNHDVFETSGELLHNSKNDETSTVSYDYWTSEIMPKPNEDYYITYRVKTVNGLSKSSEPSPIRLI
jgi:hypothetical protein